MPSIITVGGSSSTGNGTTFGDLIEKVYRRVMGGIRERAVQIDMISGQWQSAAAVTSITFNAQIEGTNYFAQNSEFFLYGQLRQGV